MREVGRTLLNRIILLVRNHAPFLVILVLGAVLRGIGVSWGIPTPDVPHLPAHYDEYTVMNSLTQVDPRRGDWNPEGAHIEGPVNYFIWVGMAVAMKMFGLIDRMPHAIADVCDKDYFRIMLAGRISTICFDLCSVLALYLIVLKMTRSKRAAWFGALLFVLFPFEVMHCHYMRPHVLGNLFICLIIYASLGIYAARDRTITYVTIGILLGLATATRYNLLPVAIVPYSAFVYRRIAQREGRITFGFALGSAFHYKMVVLGLAAVVGLLIGDWPLLTDFESVRGPLLYQVGTSGFGPITLANLLDISKPLAYLTAVLPDSSFLLWPVFYVGMAYCLFLPSQRHHVAPLYLFALPYFYYVTKSYGLLAARTIMPLFPVFVIISALAFENMVARYWRAPVFRTVVTACLGFILIGTLLFDVSMVAAMADRQADPYVQVHAYFSKPGIPDELNVGFCGIYWERYHSRNFEQILNSIPGKRAVVDGSRLDYRTHPRDYVLVFEFDATMTESTQRTLAELTGANDYVVERVFKKRMALLHVELDYTHMPTDFRYAFPVIYLLKATQPPMEHGESNT